MKDVEAVLLHREQFRINTFLVIVDCLLSELEKQGDIYKTLTQDFDLLFYLQKKPATSIRDAASRIQQQCEDDLEPSFPDELVSYSEYVNSAFQSEDTLSPPRLLQDLRESGATSAFPNVEIALRLFLTMPIANVEGERSFSVLKRVKSRLRSTMGQEKLSGLALLTIESETTKCLDFEDIIEAFALQKARRKI
ncbi:uncharacterized protein LOC101864626 [Aplysia californica]|uniref:Uncharacterized protein LOC101864626 n=1 Tax=Aplysia californica TaxID=6500 RepID=A0ABM1A1P2_APLCA|nr:uncharacterized protein LOC101864626 [Aplysia californica]